MVVTELNPCASLCMQLMRKKEKKSDGWIDQHSIACMQMLRCAGQGRCKERKKEKKAHAFVSFGCFLWRLCILMHSIQCPAATASSSFTLFCLLCFRMQMQSWIHILIFLSSKTPQPFPFSTARGVCMSTVILIKQQDRVHYTLSLYRQYQQSINLYQQYLFLHLLQAHLYSLQLSLSSTPATHSPLIHAELQMQL